MKLGAIANWSNAAVPLGAQVNEYIPALCNASFDFLFKDDLVAMAECTLLVWEYTDIDLFVLNTDCYNFEVETLGGKAGIAPFLMFLSNIAPTTPAINIRTAVEATHVYGAPEATAETPFGPVGEVESFEEYLKGKIADNEEGYTFDWLKHSEYASLAD